MKILDLLSTLCLKLLNRSDYLDIIRAVALPYRNRIAPEPVAAYSPVTCTLKPLSETSVLDMIRNPSDFLVAVKHSLLNLLDIDEPAAHRPVDQRHLSSIAERI